MKRSNRISQNIQEICLQEGKIWKILPRLGQTGNSAVCPLSVTENTITKVKFDDESVMF
jgi:hypothetical protein